MQLVREVFRLMVLLLAKSGTFGGKEEAAIECGIFCSDFVIELIVLILVETCNVFSSEQLASR